jgi:hypothetical protein
MRLSATLASVIALTLVSGADGFCSRTARTVFRACGFEIQDDYWISVANCINVSDAAQRAACLADAAAERSDAAQLCSEQLAGRLETCQSLGEQRYDPDLDPARFDDDPKNPSNPNPYFPLKVGNRWDYSSPSERDTVEVLDATKSIAGLTCLVVRDAVKHNGSVAEDTDDWFAMAKDGNVWYCGEEVKDYHTFGGDQPPTPELVSIDGSFKAGRDFAEPGIIFQATPVPGATYIEEFSLGNAEDVTNILSTSYAYGSDAELDRLVPQALAELLCAAGDCIVTRNISLLEPGLSARKYYARGIGAFLEVDLDSGEVLQLVRCNFDPRCGQLPNP